MYRTILLTVDGKSTDRAVIEHIKLLAAFAGSRVVLFHVADGWAARTYGSDAVSPEISEDTAYLERVRAEFEAAAIPAQAELAFGDPATEIIDWTRRKGCDLIAMTSHGHKLIGDIFLGSTIDKVRHNTRVPILVVGPGGAGAPPA